MILPPLSSGEAILLNRIQLSDLDDFIISELNNLFSGISQSQKHFFGVLTKLRRSRPRGWGKAHPAALGKCQRVKESTSY